MEPHAPRRVAATRKVSLAEFADDWQDCYAIVVMASLDEYRDAAAKDWTGVDNNAIVDFETQFVKDHFVTGKIRVIGSDELEDMQADDVTSVPTLPDYLYSVIMGMDLDPKGLRKAALDLSEPSSSESTTKTSSSTE